MPISISNNSSDAGILQNLKSWIGDATHMVKNIIKLYLGISGSSFDAKKDLRVVNSLERLNYTTLTLTPSSGGMARRTMPALVDSIAGSNPEKVFSIITVQDHGAPRTWRPVTFEEFASLVSMTCSWIEKVIGQPKEAEYLAYIGGTDIRYAIFIVACMKTGYVASLTTAPLQNSNVDSRSPFCYL